MNTNRRTWITLAATGVCTAVMAGSAGANKDCEIRYVLWDLGTLGGDTAPLAISAEGGHIVGWSVTAKSTETHAFRWTDDFMTDLGTLGGTWSEARGVNSAGEVVGVSTNARGEPRAFYAPRSTMIDLNELLPILPEPPGGDVAPLRVLLEANAISDTGVIAASGEVWSDENLHGFVLIPTGDGSFTYRDLGQLPGATESVALGVGPRWQVVGHSGGQPFIWKHGEIQPLEVSIGGVIEPGQANAMNHFGTVAGFSGEGWVTGPRATLWHDGVRTSLSSGMGVMSSANDLNDFGRVVGWEAIWDSLPYAMIWDEPGLGVDLMDVTAIPIAPHAFPWSRLTEATGIDENNQIIGFGTSLTGQTRAFLLTPFAPDWPTR